MGSWGLFPSGGGVVCRSEIEKVGVPGGGGDARYDSWPAQGLHGKV